MLRNLIVFPDGTELYSGAGLDNYIISVTVTECVNSGTELTIGSVCTNMLEATFISKDGSLAISAGMEITLYRVDESGTRTKVGLFTAEKPTRSSAYCWKVTAYDRVSWLDKDLTAWMASLDGWPYEMYEFAGMVCTQCGLTLSNSSLPNGNFPIQKFSADGITGRKLLSWIGEICAQFCRATPDGSIEFAWYKTASCAIGAAASDGIKYYFSGGLSYEDYQVALIEKIQIRFSDNDVGVIWPNDTEAVNTYRITGNYLLITDTTDRLLQVAQAVYNALKDITYTPGKVSLPSNQDIHAGDIVSVTDANGKQVQMYIMKRKQSGQRDTLECTGSRNRDSVTLVNNQTFEALSGKVLNLQTTVEGIKIENKDTAGNLASLSLDVSGIRSDVAQHSSDIDGLNDQMSSVEHTAEGLKVSVTNISTDLNGKADKEDVQQITEHFVFGEDGLTISNSASGMGIGVSEKQVAFTGGENPSTVIRPNSMNTTNLTVKESLTLGDFAFIPRTNGNLSFRYTGGSS